VTFFVFHRIFLCVLIKILKYMKKEHLFTFAGVILVCATIVFSITQFQKTGITIRNTGSSSGSIQNSISVSGEGKITATPDIVRISAGVSELAKTTKEAQEQANTKLERIISILEKNDVPARKVQTSNLSFRPEYDWRGDEGRKLLGQRVSQTLSIEIPDIDKNPERVTDILDSLGEIDSLELNSVNFDIEDKKNLFSSARKEAFEKAHQKAAELAKFGKVILGSPITISEANVHYNPMPFRNFAAKEMVMADGMVGGSSLPSGELNVTATVNVVFEIK
jgi:uncharacterized protein